MSPACPHEKQNRAAAIATALNLYEQAKFRVLILATNAGRIKRRVKDHAPHVPGRIAIRAGSFHKRIAWLQVFVELLLPAGRDCRGRTIAGDGRTRTIRRHSGARPIGRNRGARAART